MAIRGDGAVVISAPGNTSGLPELMIVDGQNGQLLGQQPSIPASSYQLSNGSWVNGYSPIGPPIVDSNGSIYVEYEVDQIAYPPQVTSATLYLMQIADDQYNTVTTTQLSSTSSNEHLFPGRIVPDGQGGVLATWVIAPSSGPIPTNPYQAAYVVSGSLTASYALPFTPTNFVLGPDGLPIKPTLILGDNGTVFATDGTSSGDSTNGEGPKIVAFALASGTLDWFYQAQSIQTTLGLVAAATNTGLAAKSTSNGVDTVLSFDSSGNVTPSSWTGTDVSNFGGNYWLGYSATGGANYNATPVELSSSPFYGSDGNGGNAAVQDISVQSFSQTGSNQTTITNVLQEIKTALPSYGACNSWLNNGSQQNNLSGVSYIGQMLQSNTYGHGTIYVGTNIRYDIWAFSGATNPDHTMISGLPTNGGISMVVNDVAGFFNATANGGAYYLGPRNYPGDSLRAQAMVLIHEVAHQLPVPGFQADNNNNKAEKANNKMVDINCRQLIEALQ
jgi:hypothetical protein